MEPQPPHHERLRLTDFTAFRDVSMAFVPGINVFVGESGAGKTHAMQVMYVWQLAFSRTGERAIDSLLDREFRPERRRLLVNGAAQPPSRASVSGCFGGSDWYIQIAAKGGDADVSVVDAQGVPLDVVRPIYLPAVDTIAHTRGLVTLYDEYRVDLSYSYRDLVSLMLGPERRVLHPSLDAVADVLSRHLGGELLLEGERFYLADGSTKLPVTLAAEGVRKLATLLRLIQTGWLRPGSVLFWDEPETNLNPALMDDVVQVLLTLTRIGVQVFVASHSYVMLKEFDLQAAGDDRVRFFAFERSDTGTRVWPFDTLGDVRPNAILDHYASLYDRQLTRATRRKRLVATAD